MAAMAILRLPNPSQSSLAAALVLVSRRKNETPAKAREFAFEKGDFVVYPTHGVGRVIDIEAKEIAGHKLDLFVISFEQERMMLRVPVAKNPDGTPVTGLVRAEFAAATFARTLDLGAGWFTVEQQAYADAGEDGRIARLDLVCTGYRPEGDGNG